MSINKIDLERNLNPIIKNVNAILNKAHVYMANFDISNKEEYKKDEVLVSEMHMEMAKLLSYVNELNDIAMKAMIINDKDIYFRCENSKARIVDVMEHLRNLYM